MPTLTQKIQKAIPSLMELREGCVIRRLDTYFTVVREIKDCLVCKNAESFYFTFKKSDVTIIGHPIQLNHVLKYLELKGVYYIVRNGVFFSSFADFVENKGIKLNLESNLLKDQPKPLLEWLDKIE